MSRRRYLVLAALAAGACDIPTSVPTSLPRWEQTWVVPGEPVRITAGDLLPAGITLNDDSTAFVTTVAGTTIRLTLAEMCPACVPLDATTAPKPAFIDTFHTTMSLPASLLSAQLEGEQVDIRLAHDLSFDPLSPSSDPAAPRGSIVVTVTSAGNLVGADTVRGEDVAFDSTVVLTPTVAINPTTVNNVLNVEFVISSPAGDAVEIDASDSIGVALLEGPVFASEATIQAVSLPVEGTEATLELAGLDSVLVDRVRDGALRMDVGNPFDLEGDLTLEFEMETGVIRRTLPLRPGEFTASLSFGGEDLQRLLDAGTVTVRTEGVLTSPDGTIILTPRKELVMDTSLEIVVLIGGEEENDG